MQDIHFIKMQALGNDFLILDLIHHNPWPDLTAEQRTQVIAQFAQESGDRKFGVGFDQLLTIEPPVLAEDDYATMVFNADGSQASNCLNGARAIGYYLHSHQLMLASTCLRFLGADRAAQTLVSLQAKAKQAKINTVAGQQAETQITVTLQASQGQAFGESLKLDDELNEQVTVLALVNLGNQHLLMELTAGASLKDLDLARLGQSVQEQSKQWESPWNQGINVTVISNEATTLQARVFERGVGETLACGSAAAAIGMHLKPQQGLALNYPGGNVLIDYRADQAGQVSLTSTASEVYTGLWKSTTNTAGGDLKENFEQSKRQVP